VDLGAVGLILDTNALLATADNNFAMVKIISAARRIAVPVIAIGEYRHGIARSRFANRYQQWLDAFLDASPVLDVTNETSHHYAAIHLELNQLGKSIPVNDLWIAALCRQHNLPLLSRDRHFDMVPDLKRVEW
jgi:predicted nucleic acid-binding protein